MCNDCRCFLGQLSELIRSIPFMHRRASPEEVENVLAHVSKSRGGKDTMLGDIETPVGVGLGKASSSEARPRLRLVQGSGGRGENGGSYRRK